MQHKFDGVKGYASYANAHKQGEKVEKALIEALGEERAFHVRWTVVAMPTGRFVPAFLANDHLGCYLGWIAMQPNTCTMN